MGTRILIANLPPDATAEEVKEELVHIGAPVLNVEMVPQTSPDKRSAVAEIELEWEIAKIMEANQKIRMLRGRRLKVSVLTEVH
jgi:hypothetical protein